jgi:hypothetical protein
VPRQTRPRRRIVTCGRAPANCCGPVQHKPFIRRLEPHSIIGVGLEAVERPQIQQRRRLRWTSISPSLRDGG